MKYLALCVTVLAASANFTTASAGKRMDCARFQSLQQMRMTSGAQKACPARYAQLRVLEERNQPRPESKKEEQFSLGAWYPASYA